MLGENREVPKRKEDRERGRASLRRRTCRLDSRLRARAALCPRGSRGPAPGCTQRAGEKGTYWPRKEQRGPLPRLFSR